jgi:hypothetical protein
VARNRYGWEKRSKELARKQKNDEKMKRRQGKILAETEGTSPEVEEVTGEATILLDEPATPGLTDEEKI